MGHAVIGQLRPRGHTAERGQCRPADGPGVATGVESGVKGRAHALDTAQQRRERQLDRVALQPAAIQSQGDAVGAAQPEAIAVGTHLACPEHPLPFG